MGVVAYAFYHSTGETQVGRRWAHPGLYNNSLSQGIQTKTEQLHQQIPGGSQN